MSYVLAVALGVLAGVALDELFGKKVVTELKLELAKLRVAVAADVASLLGKLAPKK